jgi:hypothetical protein
VAEDDVHDDEVERILDEIDNASRFPHGFPSVASGIEGVVAMRVAPSYLVSKELMIKAWLDMKIEKEVEKGTVTTTQTVRTCSVGDVEPLLQHSVLSSFRLGGDEITYRFAQWWPLNGEDHPKRSFIKMVKKGWQLRLNTLYNTLSRRRRQPELMKAEVRALRALRRKIKPAQWRQYFLAGAFVEHGPTSGMSYLLRKGLPTVAYRFTSEMGEPHFIGTLCMHGIGYFDESNAGLMSPTDDVITHLMMIRGDEYNFWKKANVHAMDDPMGGV